MSSSAFRHVFGFREWFCTTLIGATLWFCSENAHAQWLTQSLQLRPGWNSVFLHVDATHSNLRGIEEDFTNPIREIWMWRPSATKAQFVQNPQEPTDGTTQWSKWIRSDAANATLGAFVGDAAYLIYIEGHLNFTLNIQ